MQPLTTDVRGLAPGRIVVMTAGSAAAVARADATAPQEVLEVPVERWDAVLSEWADGGPVNVITNDEYALRDLARVREALGLDRVTPARLDVYLDKTAMKQALQDAGVTVPRWHRLPPLTEDVELPDDLDLPCVVKPIVGANSRGVRVVRTTEDWRSWVTAHLGEESWQIEQFIAGQMCFVDGLVTDGHYQPVLVGRYLGGLLPGARHAHLRGDRRAD